MKKYNIQHKELTWGVITAISFSLCIVNIYHPISSWKLLIVSITALLLSIYQILEGILSSYVSEINLNSQLNEIAELVGVPTAEFQKEKQLRAVRGFAIVLYTCAMFVLIAGLFFDFEIINTHITDTISFASLGLIFLSMSISSHMAKKANTHCVVSRDLERVKTILDNPKNSSTLI